MNTVLFGEHYWDQWTLRRSVSTMAVNGQYGSWLTLHGRDKTLLQSVDTIQVFGHYGHMWTHGRQWTM